MIFKDCHFSTELQDLYNQHGKFWEKESILIQIDWEDVAKWGFDRHLMFRAALNEIEEVNNVVYIRYTIKPR